MHVDEYILGIAYLQPKSLLCDIFSSQRHAALAGICNAEHDSQLQLPHEIIAPVPLEDVLPWFGQALVSLLLLKLSRLVLLDGLPVVVLARHTKDGLVGHHAMVVVSQEDDVCSVVVCTSWLMHLGAATSDGDSLAGRYTSALSVSPLAGSCS